MDSVIVAEIQAKEDDQGGLMKAAENAFDAGAVVIAANGNSGAVPTVASPARAHKVIGVGAYSINSMKTVVAQLLGPASDGRIKPDIQAPSVIKVCHEKQCSDCIPPISPTKCSIYDDTSCATAFAAGAAALFRNWLREFETYDPGQVYAFMILSGEAHRDYEFKDQPHLLFDSEVGAGHLCMPRNGTAWWGKLSVSDKSCTEISIQVPEKTKQIDAAIWWPQESAWWEGLDCGLCQLPFLHNDIDLYLVEPKPDGTADETAVCTSDSGPSIFEKVCYPRQPGQEITPGIWTIKISGYNVRSGPQTVYWAATARKNPFQCQ